MRLNILKEITIKEIKAQLDHLSGYVLLTIFVGLLYYFFLKTFYINGIVSMRNMFELLPWFLIVLVPAITMGSFASEIEKQTLEYLETKPVKQIELILGKILGATKVIFIAILLTLPLPFFISQISPLDIGETVSSYMGALVLVFALSCLGVAVSTFFKNQIAAFLTSALLIFALLIISSDVASINLPVSIANALAQFSIIDNYAPIIRGVINLHNIIYFVIFIITSIAIAYANIQKIRISNTTNLYRKTLSIVLVVAAVGIALAYLSDYFGQQVGRIDLTSDKRYTLSPITQEILNEEGKVIVEVYASNNLPPAYQNIASEIKNLLADFKSAGRGNIEIRYLNPDTNGERLSTLDVQPVQFNTVGEDQIQIQQAYLALVVLNENESKKEKIDYIQSINDLEYELTSIINKIKSSSKPMVGFATGNGEKSIFTEYGFLQQILSNEYDIKSVYFRPQNDASTEEQADPNLGQYNLLIIANPVNEYNEASKKYISDYINAGGNVIYMADGLSIDMETGSATLAEGFTGELLSQYGASVNKNVVYDLQQNMQIPISETLVGQYPFFPISQKDPNAESIIQNLPEIVVIPWGSTLNLDSTWQWLYSTSTSGGVQTTGVNLNPAGLQLPNENLNRHPIIATKKTDNGGTLIIMGSSRLFENNFVVSIQENAVLALNFIETLGNGKGLSQIKSKNLLGSQFNYVEPETIRMINYGAPITSAILLGLIGASRIYRKHRLAKIYA